MKKYCSIIYIALLVFSTQNIAAQKIIKTEYSGGHGCVDKSLILYTDSTFLFESTQALLFVVKSKIKGVYLLEDNAITLYRRKRFYFLHFKPENKYHENTYRIKGNTILMYSVEDENSKDAGFIKAYNTLSLSST
jgi:hypothetical protein